MKLVDRRQHNTHGPMTGARRPVTSIGRMSKEWSCSGGGVYVLGGVVRSESRDRCGGGPPPPSRLSTFAGALSPQLSNLRGCNAADNECGALVVDRGLAARVTPSP
ncbi:unnamed protein product [Macrosiphum euphorbiae]|nr:unnamed protein product [Macrosiphum euphorbiae]